MEQGVEAQVHSFLTSRLYSRGNNPCYPKNKILGGAKTWCGNVEEEI
jgi:hypothetical protein